MSEASLRLDIQRLEDAVDALEQRTSGDTHYPPRPPRSGPLAAIARRVKARKGRRT
jgi:hypothetical protein